MFHFQKSIFILSFILAPLVSAQAATTTIFKDGTPLSKQIEESLISMGLGDASDYQIGNEWGKKPVTPESLRHESKAFVRAALATARYGGATAFYLGKFNGHHMMATNHHVMPRGDICGSRSAIFPILQKKFHCQKFYGHWTGIDLALFSIDVTSAEDEKMLARVGGSFDFHSTVYPGQKLITIGFGIFRNEARELVANADSDCKVFSDKDDFRFISDPDRINPGDYQTWSVATGCDVSHGDSGSALVDRATGAVVGIIWTTTTQKDPRVMDSSFLDELLKTQGPEIWTQLSYGVPAPKMASFLRDYLASPDRPSDDDTVQTIESILSH